MFDNYAATHNDHGTDKNTIHSYGEVYVELFKNMIELRHEEGRQIDAILEIGVYSGASAVAMAEAFPSATVYGIVITMEKIRFTHERVRYIQYDATKASVLNKIPFIPLDVVIDDGSHCPEDMVASFVLFAERVAMGGYYVIEDITADVLNLLTPLMTPLSKKYGFHMEVLDRRRVKGRYDDIMMIFRKTFAV